MCRVYYLEDGNITVNNFPKGWMSKKEKTIKTKNKKNKNRENKGYDKEPEETRLVNQITKEQDNPMDSSGGIHPTASLRGVSQYCSTLSCHFYLFLFLFRLWPARHTLSHTHTPEPDYPQKTHAHAEYSKKTQSAVVLICEAPKQT